jgi:hypothetical protein
VRAAANTVQVTHHWRGCAGDSTSPPFDAGPVTSGVDSVQTLTPLAVAPNSRAPAGERTARAAVRIEAILTAVGTPTQWSAPIVTSVEWGVPSGANSSRRVWMPIGREAVTSSFDPLAPWPESAPPPYTQMMLGGNLMTQGGGDDSEDVVHGERQMVPLLAAPSSLLH